MLVIRLRRMGSKKRSFFRVVVTDSRTARDRSFGAGSRCGSRTACVVSRARDVVEVVARVLADQPDAVRVTERQHKGQTLVELFMAPGDLGRVIGRQGRTAAAMRTLVSATAELEGAKATLEFRDDG
jgi:predicted RNA-binding protein YlqC (UPF0109 family)